ncbi:MAG: hypothetical protein JWN20_302 [Jatrophihabitantaceae bacterium]|nr:hypothetical protein [Jatrophihabitantaceae bacterium]
MPVSIAAAHDYAAHDYAGDARLAVGLAVLIGLGVGALAVARVPRRLGIVTASGRAVLQLALLAAALRGVFAAPILTVGVLAVMFGVATWTAASQLSGLERAGRATVIACGAGSATVIAIIWGGGVLDQSARVLVAVSGIVFGGSMSAATLAGRHLREAMVRRRDEIEAWLAIGATMREATADCVRTAAGEAMVPALDQTRTVGLVTLPGAFVGALLGGASATDAAKFQIVVLVGLLCAEAITVVTLTYLLGAPRQLPEGNS